MESCVGGAQCRSCCTHEAHVVLLGPFAGEKGSSCHRLPTADCMSVYVRCAMAAAVLLLQRRCPESQTAQDLRHIAFCAVCYVDKQVPIGMSMSLA